MKTKMFLLQSAKFASLQNTQKRNSVQLKEVNLFPAVAT